MIWKRKIIGIVVFILIGINFLPGYPGFYYAHATSSSSRRISGLKRHQIDEIDDGDGLEVADFDLDGDIDIVIAESKLGKVSWYEQTEDLDNWKKHEIARGYEKIEGLEVLDANGDGLKEVIIFDQTPGVIDIAMRNVSSWGDVGEGADALAGLDGLDGMGGLAGLNGPESADGIEIWNTGRIISSQFYLQSGLDADIDRDADVDLVYAFEGDQDGSGGFYWVENLGGNPLQSENWVRHEIGQINGGWWLVTRRMDLNEDGTVEEIVGSSRGARNPAANPGIYSFTPNENIEDPWNISVIETGQDYTPLHVTAGNLTGGETSYDLAACAKDKGHGVYVYNYSDDYSRSVLRDDSHWHNVQALDLDRRGRDELILVDDTSKWGYRLWLYQYYGEENGEENREENGEENGEEYGEETGSGTNTAGNGGYKEQYSTYYWKADDRIIPYDLDRDGIQEIITVSANDNSVDWWEVVFDGYVYSWPKMPRWTLWGITGASILVAVLFLVYYIKKKKITEKTETMRR